MKGMTKTARILFYGGTGLALVVGGLKFAIPASAGILEAQLIVGTAPGIPGGTASVAISLADDDVSAGVSADLDIAYPSDLVTFNPPVAQNCRVADRLASTHQVGGTVPQAGLLRFAIFNATGLEPLGNGEIATCDFAVNPGVPAGTAALNVDFAELTGAEGTIPVIGVDGAIIISDATLTPTPTDTPIGDTPTATGTPTGTAVATVTRTVSATSTATIAGGSVTATHTTTATPTGGTTVPTSTHTSGPSGSPTATPTGGVTGTPTSTIMSGTPGTPTSTAVRSPTRRPTPFEDDGCNVVPTGQSSSGGMLALLLAPALLVWARRKRF